MPLTAKGSEIKSAMVKQYGEKKGTSVFYASKNKGTIKGVDETQLPRHEHEDKAKFNELERRLQKLEGRGDEINWLMDAVTHLNKGADSLTKRVDAMRRKKDCP